MPTVFLFYFFSNFKTFSVRNNSPAIDRILEVLNPTNAPGLRRLVLLPGPDNEDERLHDGYRNARLVLDLSHLETLIVDRSFSEILCQQLIIPERFPSLKRLTLHLDFYRTSLVKLFLATNGLNDLGNNPKSIFSQLTHLTFNTGRYFSNTDLLFFIISHCASSGHSSLEYLALNNSNFFTLAPLIFCFAPVAASLKYLRVELSGQNEFNWEEPVVAPPPANDHFNLQFIIPPFPANGAVFSKVTTLHLVHSKLLHRYTFS